MKNKISGIITVLLALLLCAAPLAGTALAAEPVGVSVPTEILLSGVLPAAPEEFEVVLKADDVSNPMPEGSVNGEYVLRLVGAVKGGLPVIVYDRVGVYVYTLYQRPGQNPDCVYDDTVYTMTVYVTNAENGSGLETTVVVYPDFDSEKMSSPQFKNVYVAEEPQPTPPPAPTPTPGGGDENNTGDTFDMGLYLALAGGSAAVLGVQFLTRKKEEPAE